MRSIDILRREHETMEAVLVSLDRAAGDVQAGAPVDEELFQKALRFISGFGHGFHQAREEILLHRMSERGLVGTDACGHNARRSGTPERIAPFLDIAEFAVACLRCLPDASRGDAAARRMLSENAKAYVGLVRSHMQREETEVFAAAEAGMSDQDDRAMLSLFRAAEREFGKEAARQYEMLAREVSGETGPPQQA